MKSQPRAAVSCKNRLPKIPVETSHVASCYAESSGRVMNLTIDNARSFARCLLEWAREAGGDALEAARRIYQSSDFNRILSWEAAI